MLETPANGAVLILGSDFIHAMMMKLIHERKC
jgi:hypothetical protein